MAVKASIKTTPDLQVDALANKVEMLDTVDEDGKPTGPSWSLQSVARLIVEIFGTKPIRVSS